MAAKKTPVKVGPTPVGERKDPFSDLDDRVANARKNLETSHSDMFPVAVPGAAPAPDAPPVEVPILATTELVETETPAAAPEPAAPAPEPAPAPAAPAPAPAPVAAAPETPAAPEAPKPPTGIDWREFRRVQKEMKKTGRAPEPGAPAPAPAAATPETDADDPFGYKAEIRKVREESDRRIADMEARLGNQNTETNLIATINTQEATFRAEHPDYDDAIKHLITVETGRYQRSGGARYEAGEMIKWLSTQEALPENQRHPDAARLRTAIDTEGDARNVDDTTAAMKVATDLYIGRQRNLIVQGALAEHVPVPQKVWETATEFMGYQPKARAAADPAAPAPAALAPAPTTTVAEKIRREARASAAGKSISNAASSAATEPDMPQIKTLKEWAAFHSRDPQGARQYMAEMNATDPKWISRLSA
jgi:hypothetical protein